MTGNELARRTGTYGQATLSERQQYAVALARSGDLLPKNYWDSAKPDPNGGIIPPAPNPGKVLYMTETAAMLGIHPMAGLTNIHIIEGKPTLSAALWGALAREAGHRLRVWIEGDGDKLQAVATLTRADDPDFEYKVIWSHTDAQKAGLLGKDNWKKYERSMLKSRAITEVIREGAPEVGMGAAYTPEELGAAVTESGEPIDFQQVPDMRETPPAQRPQAPIVDEQPEPQPNPEPSHRETAEAPTEAPQEAPAEGSVVSFDWLAAIAAAGSKADAAALYQRARQDGALTTKVKVGRKNRELGEYIIEVGKAFADAEEAAKAAEGDVVDAEIVEDGEAPMALGDQ